MAFFKILLIILVSLPLVAFIVALFLQVLGYIRGRNKADERRRIAMMRAEEEAWAEAMRNAPPPQEEPEDYGGRTASAGSAGSGRKRSPDKKADRRNAKKSRDKSRDKSKSKNRKNEEKGGRRRK